jgi:hypothetical protein
MKCYEENPMIFGMRKVSRLFSRTMKSEKNELPQNMNDCSRQKTEPSYPYFLAELLFQEDERCE